MSKRKSPADTQVIADEAEAEAAYQAEFAAASAANDPVPTLGTEPVSTICDLVTEWANTLTPKNAPSPLARGSLSWVRQDKVPELLEILNKAGYQ